MNRSRVTTTRRGNARRQRSRDRIALFSRVDKRDGGCTVRTLRFQRQTRRLRARPRRGPARTDAPRRDVNDEDLVPVKAGCRYNRESGCSRMGPGVDLANVKMSMNPFDEIAVDCGDPGQGEGVASDGRGCDIDQGGRRPPSTIRLRARHWARTGLLVRRRGRSSSRSRWRRCSSPSVESESPGLVIHGGQAGDRRRLQPDRPDARRPAGLGAGHLRLEGRARRGHGRRHPRGRRRPSRP